MLLGLNGLRCGELIDCNVEDLGHHSWHHTLKPTTTKGDRPTVVALAPPIMQASPSPPTLGAAARCGSTGRDAI